jgi:nucleotidyltransferase/DNA polymerase involved in DNA repair
VFVLIVCVLIPRFELAVAAGGREALAAGPVALAPEAGREQLIGEVSAAAEAYGIRAGLRLGEALARCPTLRLVTPDPAGVADEWDRLLGTLEGIGAAVEPGRPGLAWFGSVGLRNLYGGSVEGVIAAARRALGTPARLGAAPSRFAALAAASRARVRKAEVAPAGPGRLAAYLAPLPVDLLTWRAETAALPPVLERFGIRTLGELAKLPRSALADRFGAAGPLARNLARGRDAPLRPRRAAECLEERLDLPESASGSQLERALGLLIDRLLARRERRGRPLRAAVLAAKLVEGGTWRARVTFREPLADPRRMRLVLAPRLAELPSPADALRLRAEGFGPPTGDQRSLLAEAAAVRAARLREAVRQARVAAGPDAALRILPVDPDSRVPERRLALTPWDP